MTLTSSSPVDGDVRPLILTSTAFFVVGLLQRNIAWMFVTAEHIIPETFR